MFGIFCGTERRMSLCSYAVGYGFAFVIDAREYCLVCEQVYILASILLYATRFIETEKLS